MKTKNSSRFIFRVFGALLTFLFASLIAQAQAFVSARTGVDAGTCPITSPCRSITYSLAQIGGGGSGTVNIIDSGNYEPFTVNNSVTVQAAPGVVAVITRNSAGPGVTIDAQGNELVTIRGLTLNLPDNLFSPNPSPVSPGFNVTGGGTVVIERCIVRGFTIGIDAKMIGLLFIRDTQVSGGTTGFNINANSLSLKASLIRCAAVRTGTAGLNATTSPSSTLRLTAIDSEFSASNLAVKVMPDATGIADVNFESCSMVNSRIGIHADGAGATVRVSNSTITGSSLGVVAASGSTLISRGNNTVEGNQNNGNFTGTFPAK